MLDIVSVINNDEDHLFLNYNVVFPLNQIPIDWYVVNNSESKLPPNSIELPPVPRRDKIDRLWQNSFQHGSSMNSTFPVIAKTPNRFVLYLDPDFYVIPEFNTILNHMVEKELDFFGCAYHQFTYHHKTETEFPLPHCLFIDKTRINIEELDFNPGWGKYPKNDYDYPDTSFSFRKTWKSKSRWEGTKDVRDGSIEYVYGLENLGISRQYMWQDKAFAIHDNWSTQKDLFLFVRTLRRLDGIL